ncbi:MAG: hypothetical protein PF483_06995 [Halothiobacillus sp.]|jgi:hypothetical protein|nr:hypothetical protein [Halothiobacillus sp.]
MSENPDDPETILRWGGVNSTQRHHAADVLESMGLGDMHLDNRQVPMQQHVVTIQRHNGTHTFTSNTVLEDHMLLLIGPAGHTGLMVGEEVEIAFDQIALMGTVEKIGPTHRDDDIPGSEIVWLRTLPAPIHETGGTAF